MKRKKWGPVIINIMADGSRVDDLTKYTIPAGHSYYDIVASIYQKGALVMGYEVYPTKHGQ